MHKLTTINTSAHTGRESARGEEGQGHPGEGDGDLKSGGMVERVATAHPCLR
jgi:hypothetical protein